MWTADCFDGAWPNAPHRVLRNETVDRYLRTGVGRIERVLDAPGIVRDPARGLPAA